MNKFFGIYKKLTNFRKSLVGSKIENILNIKKGINEIIQTKNFKNKPKILWMSFSIFEPCKVHDFFLAQSLKLRGAEIVPIICDSLQEGQCSVYGGIWGGYEQHEDQNRYLCSKNCTKCIKDSLVLWQDWCDLFPVFISKYLNEKERLELKIRAYNYDLSDYENWNYDGMPVGTWTLNILCNNWLVGDEKLVFNYKEKLYAYLYNILLCIEVFKKIINEINPDIILSNDSFYYPWSILEFIAAKKNIPFYSTWVGGLKNKSFYAKGESAALMNLESVWNVFKNREFTLKESKAFRYFWEKRPSGKNMILNVCDHNKNSNLTSDDNLNLNFNKPTVILASNVIWDLAALNRNIQFNGMMDWIFNVIDFFIVKQEFNLIIKAHPAEVNKNIPKTKQLIKDEIYKKYKNLSSNICVLGPESNYSLYKLFPYIDLALVYTSTAGIEMVCEGIPVVTAGRSHYISKGFTYDTNNKKDFFNIIETLLTTDLHEKNKDLYKKLAQKFFYLYYFVYFIDLELFESSVSIDSILVKSAYKLLPGVNSKLDYVCDSILKHLPIVSQDRMPPV